MSDDRVRLDLGPAAQETLARVRALDPWRHVTDRHLLAMAVGYGLDHLARLATPQENAPMIDAVRVNYPPNSGLTEGRVVHYVLPDGHGRNPGAHRPALVVRVWRTPATTTEAGVPTGCVQLAVFVDGTNDYENAVEDHSFLRPMWATSVMHDEDEKKPGSWHWIERA